METHSTHTIHVTRVEEDAAGGLVGLARLARGGVVGTMQRMRAGRVPGSGNHDSVPRLLERGAFVLKKAAVQRIGTRALAQLERLQPALLTPGEWVASREAVSRHGVGLFSALNAMSMPLSALAQQVQGFASGGRVGWVSRAAQVMRQLPRNGQDALALPPLAGPPRAPPEAERGPTQTIRVELISGARQVTVHADARDEGTLLDLLRDARARSQ
jgi:hypothetical protein